MRPTGWVPLVCGHAHVSRLRLCLTVVVAAAILIFAAPAGAQDRPGLVYPIFQFPADAIPRVDGNDWDANQPPVLVDAEFRGQDRKLLLHANRNGYFYVLDRVTGEFLIGEPFVEKLTWSSGIDETGRPILTANNQTTEAGVRTCPAVRGATNWYSPAYSPRTGLFYVMSVEDCTLYRKAQLGGFGRINDPLDPAMKYLRAIDIQTGEIRWEVAQVGEVERNYSGVLATSTDLVFYGQTSGGFAAVDANTGDTLWHFEAGAVWKGSPMTYSVNGRQYVAIASGANILSFALPEE